MNNIFRHKMGRLFFLFLVIVMVYIAGCKKESVFQKKSKPEVTIGANDNRLNEETIHFFKDTVYVLAVSLKRDSGQTLLIDAGTLIKVNNQLSITINSGATIDAKGSASDPIIFTSSAFAGSAGVLINGGTGSVRFWNGIRIYGNASNNPASGSGTLSYVRIEFAGGSENGLSLPCLLFNNVGSQTTIENIQVSYSLSTPSFEFYGGNCNARNLVSYATVSTDFYIHQGYKGMLQNLFAYRHPYFASPSPGPAFAGLILEDSTTFPLISNLTVLGPDLQLGTQHAYFDTIRINIFGGQEGRAVAGLITTKAAKFHVRNSVLLGFPKAGWYLDDKSTALSLYYNESDFTYSIVHSNDSSRIFYLSPAAYPPYTSIDFKTLVMQSQFANQIFLNSSEFNLTDPFNYDINPNPLPLAGSAVLGGANFDGVFGDPFFKKVDYRGALGTDNWMQGWTNFIPLQTHYND